MTQPTQIRDLVKDVSAQIVFHEREAARLSSILDGLLDEVRKRPSKKEDPKKEPVKNKAAMSPAAKAARTKKARKKDGLKNVNDETLSVAKENILIYLRKHKGGHVATEIYKQVRHGQDTLRRAIMSLADEGLIKSEQVTGGNHAKTIAWSAAS